MNRAGLPEAVGYEFRCHIDDVRGRIELIFDFGRREVADVSEQLTVIEPVDPLERVVLDCLKGDAGIVVDVGVDDCGGA